MAWRRNCCLYPLSQRVNTPAIPSTIMALHAGECSIFIALADETSYHAVTLCYFSCSCLFTLAVLHLLHPRNNRERFCWNHLTGAATDAAAVAAAAKHFKLRYFSQVCAYPDNHRTKSISLSRVSEQDQWGEGEHKLSRTATKNADRYRTMTPHWSYHNLEPS